VVNKYEFAGDWFPQNRIMGLQNAGRGLPRIVLPTTLWNNKYDIPVAGCHKIG
jgi:hypothetical protein